MDWVEEVGMHSRRPRLDFFFCWLGWLVGMGVWFCVGAVWLVGKGEYLHGLFPALFCLLYFGVQMFVDSTRRHVMLLIPRYLGR